MIPIIGMFLWGLIWGFATNAVVRNKGYHENWFWWGFIFGFIAFLVACTKPQVTILSISNESTSNLSRLAQEGYRIGSHNVSTKRLNTLAPGDWRCTCGTINASYVGTCRCGKSINEIRNKIESNEDIKTNIEKAERTNDEDNEYLNLRKLNEYKILFGSGVITEEQFNKKKNELLDL